MWLLWLLWLLLCLCFCFVGDLWCLLEDAGKRDYCVLNGCVADIYIYICMYMLFMPMLLAIYAYAVGNMDVKSVDTLNYLLFHLRLGPPTFRPPLRLKSLL